MPSTRNLPRAVAALAVVGALAVASVGTAVAQSGGSSSMADPTIVEIAASNDDFSTLVTAVTEAGLVETLSGEGPFTVFAPTDEAFAKIPEADLQAILADKDVLTEILTYHVLAGEVLSTDLKKKQKVETVQGDKVNIKLKKKGATINGANIVQTDIQASNGVIHVIDTVLLPKDLR